MFCTNCGSQIADNSIFCPECGTRLDGPVPVEAQAPVYQEAQAPMYHETQEMAPRRQSGEAPRKRKSSSQSRSGGKRKRSGRNSRSVSMPVKILCFVMAAINLVQIILWFVPAIRFDASVLGVGLSESHSMNGFLEKLVVITAIVVIFLVAALALNVIYGLIKPMKLTTVIGIISTIIYFGLLMVTKAVNDSEAQDMGLGSSAVRFTIGGKLMLILSVVVLVLYIVRPILRRITR